MFAALKLRTATDQVRSPRQETLPGALVPAGSRVSSIDVLRGAVMIIMALDHVRDFFHAGAMTFSPTDLRQTTPVLFFTRWITHFCLPVFVFTAGLGVFFYARSRTKSQVARFLWTRGLWFIVLELTVMQFAYTFSFSSSFLIFLLILWIFGICMLAMSALVYLPMRWLATVSVVVIVCHNLLDGIGAAKFGSGAWVWNLLHQPGVISVAGRPVLVTYTFLPWVGVLAAGFCFGRVFLLESAARRRIIAGVGVAFTIAFFVLRALNRYGDPAPWVRQHSQIFTALSFLNCTKYPGSLDFLLMTLGPALLALAWLDRWTPRATNPLVVFGRVPFFYFVLHFYLIHLLAVLAAWLRYGTSAAKFTFGPWLSMGGSRALFPANFGYPLWVAYGVWILVVVLLYPLCRWFANVKATRRDWWLSYL
ncbi:MAG TPA: heparan-alpha-glucosaminide N-acetyltransferase domain-containing protein [Candidatus Angelobacter sp.]|nr:heparan-alpha-glucosaminide N-acetyltransferase domain-containing protein [Candidatus Angelobacter sp.]